ncbi:MAG: LysM peptidoglycan-binding domain-containing protein [Nevskiaceae bacterium]|nr:MAG: LysM peptidoglycan-binding domain-containing protein [Nevskiaceae bacterium]
MRRRTAGLIIAAMIPMLSGCSGLLHWDAPAASRPATHSHKVKPAASEPARTPLPEGDEYRVRAGDTLYSIAFRNQVDYRELARWNDIGRDYRINPGQMLRLRPPTAGGAIKPPAEAVTTVVKREEPAPVPVSADEAPTAQAGPGDAPQGFEWLWPTTGTILRTYAPKDGFKGLDFGGNLGQPVFAAAPGRVVYSGNALKGYGELIIIKHNDAYLSAYGYNRRRNVKEGDVVTAGQPIAELGLGPENKPFLHFEIRERGQPVDPMRFLPKRETTPGAK